MHTVVTMKHWGHHLYDGIQAMRHEIVQHLHSRHFWTGVGVTLLIIGLAVLFFMLVRYAPLQMHNMQPYSIPYVP